MDGKKKHCPNHLEYTNTCVACVSSNVFGLSKRVDLMDAQLKVAMELIEQQRKQYWGEEPDKIVPLPSDFKNRLARRKSNED